MKQRLINKFVLWRTEITDLWRRVLQGLFSTHSVMVHVFTEIHQIASSLRVSEDVKGTKSNIYSCHMGHKLAA